MRYKIFEIVDGFNSIEELAKSIKWLKIDAPWKNKHFEIKPNTSLKESISILKEMDFIWEPDPDDPYDDELPSGVIMLINGTWYEDQIYFDSFENEHKFFRKIEPPKF